MGAHDFILNKVPLFTRTSVNSNVSLSARPKLPFFARKPGNINVSRSAAPKLAFCQRAVISAMSSCQTSMSVPSFSRIERGSDGGHDFKRNKVSHFRSINCKYQCLEVCCPKTNSCASKPLLLRCKVVIL